MSLPPSCIGNVCKWQIERTYIGSISYFNLNQWTFKLFNIQLTIGTKIIEERLETHSLVYISR